MWGKERDRESGREIEEEWERDRGRVGTRERETVLNKTNL